MNELLKIKFFKNQIFAVISDRDCEAIKKAADNCIKTFVYKEVKSIEFCNLLLEYLVVNKIDYVISFYTKLFTGEILNVYSDRIINLHLSILPSFKGLKAFENNIKYGSRFIGSTIHFIDENIDEGKIIIQTVFPVDDNKDLTFLRHQIFRQQCQSLLQVVKWLKEDKIKIKDNKVIVQNASFSTFEFSPSLEYEEAINLNIPIPK